MGRTSPNPLSGTHKNPPCINGRMDPTIDMKGEIPKWAVQPVLPVLLWSTSPRFSKQSSKYSRQNGAYDRHEGDFIYHLIQGAATHFGESLLRFHGRMELTADKRGKRYGIQWGEIRRNGSCIPYITGIIVIGRASILLRNTINNPLDIHARWSLGQSIH